MVEQKIIRELMDAIDGATGPDRMSKEIALMVLEGVDTELQGRMEALRDEIKDDG